MNEREGTDPGPGGDGVSAEADDEAGAVVARVAEYDEELAEEVRHAVAGRDGEDEDEDPEAEAESDSPGDPDATGESAPDRTEELEAELADREARIEDLEERIEEYESELEDLQSRLKRKQADFQNYKKRAEKKRERIQERATEDLVERLIDVRDDLKRGIEEDHPDVESLKGGLEMVLRKFDRILEEENVTEIAPDPGETVDPERHEVMVRVDSDHPEGAVAEVYSPGYEMAGKVIRAAKVTVSTGPAEDDAEAEAPEDGTDDEGSETAEE